ncbi:hypothetical protein AwPolaro_02780 [Polaromonas sp.]|nr:hypothetical protein AwPolaro_02780 [Polaromonas sp.]
MAPMLVASRTALPPEGVASPKGGLSARLSPTLVASRTALPPEGTASPKGGLSARLSPTLVTSRTALQRGFTLIELLVALAAMALMAGLSWRGLDGMMRAQTQISQQADAVLTLQAGLTQWNADLDALLQLPRTPTLDWDGRGLRIVRRSTVRPGDGALVVAWAQRNINGTDYWLRWQSAPQFSRVELQTAWAQAAQWAQNPGDAEKQKEVRITALAQWRIFYFRDNAWSNPMSSGNANVPDANPSPNPNQNPDQNPNQNPNPAATNQALPDGIRLVLTLPDSEAISGVLTRDWVRPTLGDAKS